MNPSSMCEDKSILIEILSRLPAKSLVRFLSVCRLWESIITSPQFRLASNRPTRLLVHTNRECYAVVEDEEEEEKKAEVVFEADFPLRHLSYEIADIVGSDNGLICLVIDSFSRNNGKVYPWFTIWNPCIRKHVVIPDHPDGYFGEFCYGFGATLSGLDHKFVRLVGYTVSIDEHGGTAQKAFHVYSLKAGTWRGYFLDYESYLCRSFSQQPVSLRGRLHWVVNDSSCFNHYTNYISTLDLEDEVFENNAMGLPQHLSTVSSVLFTQRVTVVKESLAVIALEYRKNCSLWVMQEYGDVSSWVKLWNIDRTMEDFDMFHSRMVGVLKNGHLLLRLNRTFDCTSKLVTCDPKTMKTNDFGGGVLLSPSEVRGFTNYYKESLVLLADDDRAVADHKLLSMCPSDIHNAYHTMQDEFGYYYVWTGIQWVLLDWACPWLSSVH